MAGESGSVEWIKDRETVALYKLYKIKGYTESSGSLTS